MLEVPGDLTPIDEGSIPTLKEVGSIVDRINAEMPKPTASKDDENVAVAGFPKEGWNEPISGLFDENPELQSIYGNLKPREYQELAELVNQGIEQLHEDVKAYLKAKAQ